jgi:hypothetical protein
MKGDFKTRGEAYMNKDKKAQERHGVMRANQLVFPGRNKIPMKGRVALWLLQRSDARIVDSLKDIQKEDK